MSLSGCNTPPRTRVVYSDKLSPPHSGYNTSSRTNTPSRTRVVYPDTPSPPDSGYNTPPRIGTSGFCFETPSPQTPLRLRLGDVGQVVWDTPEGVRDEILKTNTRAVNIQANIKAMAKSHHSLYKTGISTDQSTDQDCRRVFLAIKELENKEIHWHSGSTMELPFTYNPQTVYTMVHGWDPNLPRYGSWTPDTLYQIFYGESLLSPTAFSSVLNENSKISFNCVSYVKAILIIAGLIDLSRPLPDITSGCGGSLIAVTPDLCKTIKPGFVVVFFDEERRFIHTGIMAEEGMVHDLWHMSNANGKFHYKRSFDYSRPHFVQVIPLDQFRNEDAHIRSITISELNLGS